MTQREKMMAGELYLASDPELVQMRLRARQMTRAYNSTVESETDVRRAILNRLLGKMSPKIEIEPPFRCDYGVNIFLGDNFYANFGCVILDCGRVEIGDNVLFGPNVQIFAAHHPLDAPTRASGLELGSNIKIGSDVWIGGGAILLPGVSIGDGTTVGAGSVVTKDIPAHVVAVGNPCRVIRELA